MRGRESRWERSWWRKRERKKNNPSGIEDIYHLKQWCLEFQAERLMTLSDQTVWALEIRGFIFSFPWLCKALSAPCSTPRHSVNESYWQAGTINHIPSQSAHTCILIHAHSLPWLGIPEKGEYPTLWVAMKLKLSKKERSILFSYEIHYCITPYPWVNCQDKVTSDGRGSGYSSSLDMHHCIWKLLYWKRLLKQRVMLIIQLSETQTKGLVLGLTANQKQSFLLAATSCHISLRTIHLSFS